MRLRNLALLSILTLVVGACAGVRSVGDDLELGLTAGNRIADGTPSHTPEE